MTKHPLPHNSSSPIVLSLPELRFINLQDVLRSTNLSGIPFLQQILSHTLTQRLEEGTDGLGVQR